MVASTPNRAADPIWLESFDPPAIIRQCPGLNLPYRNYTGSTLVASEPVILNGKVCLCVGTILPGEEGRVITEWMADCILDTGLVGNILQNDVVWWSYDVTVITGCPGAVVNVAPTNGFILGRAICMPGEIRLASGDPLAATAGDLRIRVVSSEAEVTALGTVPTFNG